MVLQECYVLEVFRVVIVTSLISRKHVFLNIPLNKKLVGSVNHGKAKTGNESRMATSSNQRGNKECQQSTERCTRRRMEGRMEQKKEQGGEGRRNSDVGQMRHRKSMRGGTQKRHVRTVHGKGGYRITHIHPTYLILDAVDEGREGGKEHHKDQKRPSW